MGLEPELIRLKELIFRVDEVSEQHRLISATIEKYKEESARAEKLAKDPILHFSTNMRHSSTRRR